MNNTKVETSIELDNLRVTLKTLLAKSDALETKIAVLKAENKEIIKQTLLIKNILFSTYEHCYGR